MRSLWRLRGGVASCIGLSVLAAVWSLYRISLLPPGLTPRGLELATASTQVVVDTPTSSIFDLRQNSTSLEGLRNRSVLLGNFIASQPLRESIARRVGVPADELQVAAPRTPEQPRAVVGLGADRRATDILRSNDQYRLNIQVNPTVPVLEIDAQAPTARSAAALANGAVDALNQRVDELVRSTATPTQERVQLLQLGRASGVVINGGIKWQAAILAFCLTLALSCATLVFLSRVREGWRFAAHAERAAKLNG